MNKQDKNHGGNVNGMKAVDLKRRQLLKATGAAAVAGCAIHAAPAQADDAPGMVKGDLLVLSKGDATAPLKADDIKVGTKPVLVWPFDLNEKKARSESRLNKLMLVRVDPADMTPEMKAVSANGVIAYSAICTHQGCDVPEFGTPVQYRHCHR